MAKKQTFGTEALEKKAAHRKMAKVIISAKSTNGKYSFKESMVDQDDVNEFIKKKTS